MDGEEQNARLISADFSASKSLLIAGFDNGNYYVHSVPDFILIQSVNILNGNLQSLAINNSGDLIAFAGLTQNKIGELLVWDWESESIVSNQKSQLSNCLAVDFSPNGEFIATAGDDSIIKLWNSRDGFCFISFDLHKGPITALKFASNGRFFASSSLGI